MIPALVEYRVLKGDHGPEFEAKVFQKLLAVWRVKDESVPKAQPQDNGYLETFHGSLMKELLDSKPFHTLGEARSMVGMWLCWYNGEGLHQSLGYRTPWELWEVGPQGASPVAT